jgi:hypothetical protein
VKVVATILAFIGAQGLAPSIAEAASDGSTKISLVVSLIRKTAKGISATLIYLLTCLY